MNGDGKLTRRDLLKTAAAASVGVLAAPMLNIGRFRLFANSETEYSTRAIDLVSRSTVIDMLCVLTLDFKKYDKWMADPESFTAIRVVRSSRQARHAWLHIPWASRSSAISSPCAWKPSTSSPTRQTRSGRPPGASSPTVRSRGAQTIALTPRISAAGSGRPPA